MQVGRVQKRGPEVGKQEVENQDNGMGVCRGLLQLWLVMYALLNAFKKRDASNDGQIFWGWSKRAEPMTSTGHPLLRFGPGESEEWDCHRKGLFLASP